MIFMEREIDNIQVNMYTRNMQLARSRQWIGHAAVLRQARLVAVTVALNLKRLLMPFPSVSVSVNKIFRQDKTIPHKQSIYLPCLACNFLIFFSPFLLPLGLPILGSLLTP